MLLASSLKPSLLADSSTGEITGGFRFVSPGFENQKRWKVEGEKAQFLPGDEIEIRPVHGIVYGRNEPDYLIETEWARVHQTTKDIWTDAPVKIIRGNTKVTGLGLRWNTGKKTARIVSQVKMNLDLGEARIQR
ncbi:MAG: LPS export ABC transporter periplasmic protein LptC [Chlamydiae bacterium]|nr:LPS export ABC transporter periplasmic protein LptC [Chlamydiota bacterium]MBI3277483.1 LPS export ABC transporter periplasmic protein LptC [Chlamydiota bacterium]